jgi:hypothetical protein
MTDREADFMMVGSMRRIAVLVLSLVVVIALAYPVFAQDGTRGVPGGGSPAAAGAEDSAQQELADVAASEAAESGFAPWWAMTHTPTTGWSAPSADAAAWAKIPQWRYLQVVSPAESDRVLTVDPRSNAYAYVDVAMIGPVGPPPDIYFGVAPPDTEELGLPGRIVGAPDAFEVPSREHYFALEAQYHSQRVTAEGRVDMEDGSSWVRIGDRRYVPSNNVRLPRPPDRKFEGRWIDADLREPVLVTAYEGDRAVYSAMAVKGTSAFPSRLGVFRILRRVANETMDSATLGIPRNSANGYYLKDVLYTQYFTPDGAALHYNYWLANWGYAGSHGCLGMNLDDSRFFWEFAGVGTPVYVHN